MALGTDDASRRTIGRYSLHGEIAVGGMGAVHLARVIEPGGPGRTVAVKRAHPHLAREPDFVLMFLDEARLSLRIRHPNVVSTIDAMSVPPDLLLVMEYVHGESLWRLSRAANAKGERVPVAVAAATVVDALRGLHAAHEATDDDGETLGIVHRDVSPHNILVGVDGIARIVDFGIAKAAGRLHSTQGSAVTGKFAYMAPEQIRDEPVSRLTDTYAAGIVLWELLTGERLFAGRTDAETIHKCLVARVRAPSRFAPDLGPRVDEVLKKALSRDPSLRYATAEEMARDVEGCLPVATRDDVGAWVRSMASDTLAARAETVAEIERTHPGASFSARRTKLALVGALVALLAGAGLVTFAAIHGRPAPAAAPLLAPSPSLVTAPPAPAPAAPASAADSVSTTDVPSAAQAPAPSPSASTVATRPAARPARPRPTPRPGRARSCDPPYSVDAQGRQIFKPECM